MDRGTTSTFYPVCRVGRVERSLKCGADLLCRVACLSRCAEQPRHCPASICALVACVLCFAVHPVSPRGIRVLVTTHCLAPLRKSLDLSTTFMVRAQLPAGAAKICPSHALLPLGACASPVQQALVCLTTGAAMPALSRATCLGASKLGVCTAVKLWVS